MTMDELDTLFLPALLTDIREVFGAGVALGFAAEFGGKVLSIPKTPYEAHPVARAFGMPLLVWLVEQYAGIHDGKLEVPFGPLTGCRGKSWQVMRQALAEGKSVRQAAQMAGVAIRTARRHRSGQSGQALRGGGGLFDKA